MAVIGSNVMTLSDWAKRHGADGKPLTIAELLAETNPILDDMMFIEGNGPTSHRQGVRTGLPNVVWRKLNAGVPKSKSTVVQVDETMGSLEARGELDVDLASLGGNLAETRLSEASAFIQAMNHQMAETVFYGDHTSKPEEFLGLTPRFDSLSAANAQNIIDAGGTGSDNTSIWVLVWNRETVCGIFPKGSQAGLVHEDLGVGDAFDGNNDRFRAYMDRWVWKCGLAMKDWRYAVRIANIDVSNLVSGSSAANLINLLIKAMHRIQNLTFGRAAIYCNRTVATMLDVQRHTTVAGAGMQYIEVDGKWTPSFRGVPIRSTDALRETEARVV
jgi:hypothetical protein